MTAAKGTMSTPAPVVTVRYKPISFYGHDPRDVIHTEGWSERMERKHRIFIYWLKTTGQELQPAPSVITVKVSR
jgi:hypothetical protein